MATNSAAYKSGRGGWRLVVSILWRVMRANPLSLVGFVLIIGIGAAAVVVVLDPHLIVPYGPRQFTGDRLQSPTLQHPLGTDNLGLDLYSNVLLALPLDLGLALAIGAFAGIFGGGLGLVAGFYDQPNSLGRVGSAAILRVTDVFLAFPSLILALAINVALGFGVWQLTVAVMATWWPYYVRLIRGEVLAVKHRPYIDAARAAGVKESRILTRHVLRNVLEPFIVYFTLDLGTILVTLSTIGFVAKAITYPSSTPEWGSMMAYYQSGGVVTAYPWLVFAPGLAIFVTVLAFSLLGDGLRDLLDPRSRRALMAGLTGSHPPEESPSLESGAPGAVTSVAVEAS